MNGAADAPDPDAEESSEAHLCWNADVPGRVDLLMTDGVGDSTAFVVESVIRGEGWVVRHPVDPSGPQADVLVRVFSDASYPADLPGSTIDFFPDGIRTTVPGLFGRLRIRERSGFDARPDGEWVPVLQQFLRDHDPDRFRGVGHQAAMTPAPFLGPNILRPLPPGESILPPPSTGHRVFISYSRTDQEYVDQLVARLGDAGLTTWIDKTIDYGDRWLQVIKDQVDSCVALVVVMTPAAEDSTWVEREIHRAEMKGKPVLPLLLEGDTFFRFGHIQYEDVTSGSMPSDGFVERLQRLASG